jgi:hypothetical protein
MRWFFFTLTFLLSVASSSLRADSESLCPYKLIDSGSAAGIYVDNNCGDNCWSTIELDNGDHFTFMCADDEAEELFGSPGNRVAVEYTVEQFWDVITSQCKRTEIVKSGKIIAAQEAPPQASNSDASPVKSMPEIGHLKFALVDRGNNIRNPLGNLTMDKFTTLCLNSASASEQTWETLNDGLVVLRLTYVDQVTTKVSRHTYCFQPVDDNAVLTRIIFDGTEFSSTDELHYVAQQLLVQCAPRLQ